MKVYTEVIRTIAWMCKNTTYPKQVNYFEHVHDRMMCVCDAYLQCTYGSMVELTECAFANA